MLWIFLALYNLGTLFTMLHVQQELTPTDLTTHQLQLFPKHNIYEELL